MSLAPAKLQQQQQQWRLDDEEEAAEVGGGATTIKYIIYQQFSCQVQGVC